MGILAGANELVTAFIGLEMSSISTYILVGFRKRALKSNEASLKYFLLGSFATAFFLYGVAMVYGATGSTKIDAIQTFLLSWQATHSGPSLSRRSWVSGLIFVGLGFKVVAAPFQVYGPDVYEGAPTPVTALLASAPKAATFGEMLRIFKRRFRIGFALLVLGDLGLRRTYHARWQPRGSRPDQREAHARVLFHRPCWLHFGRFGRLARAVGTAALLFYLACVRAHESGRVSGGHSPRAAG